MAAKYSTASTTINTANVNNNNNNNNNHSNRSTPIPNFDIGLDQFNSAPTYNISHNLQVEWDFLKKRMTQIEQALGVPPANEVETPLELPQQFQQPDFDQDDDYEDNSENIDPSLFDPDELMSIYQHTVPHSKYLKVESNGLFAMNSFKKKDIVQVLMYLNMADYAKDLKTNKRSNGDKFETYLHNKNHKIEEAFKHSPTSVNDLIKRITKVLPTKKIVWLMIEKFFTSIADPLVSVLDEKEFIENISKIIGPRELVDAKINPKINIDDNYQIAEFTYLIIIIRIIQISLLTTTKLDKQSNFLLKNSQISNEYDQIIELLLMLLGRFNVNQLTQLRLKLFGAFLSLENFYGDTKDFTDTTALAISLNLNNKDEVGSDPTLTRVWYYTYFLYYTINQRKGLPVLINEDIFNLDFISNPGTGLKFNESLSTSFMKQVEINNVIQKIVNKLNDYSSQWIPFTTIDKLLRELDETLALENGDFQTFKKSVAAVYSDKLVKTFNHLQHILLRLNVLNVCLLHFEHAVPNDKTRFLGYINDYFKNLSIGVQDCFDILRNYPNYYYSGYEFILYPLIIHFFERVTDFLQNTLIRTRFVNKDSLGLLKLLANIIVELENFPILSNYFIYWKTLRRSKLFLHILKKHYFKTDGFIDLFNLHPVADNVELDFTNLVTSSFLNLAPLDAKFLEDIFHNLNDNFDTKYSKMNNVYDFYFSLDLDEPQFDLDLFL